MSTSSSSSSDTGNSDEFFNEILQDFGQEIEGYMFQPTRTVNDSDSDRSSSDSSTYNTRLQNCDCLLIVFGSIILIANVVTFVIFRNRILRSKKSSLLLVSMTAADALVGLTAIALSFSLIHAFRNGSPVGSFLFGFTFLFQWSISASIISVSAISIERLIAVLWPFSHRLARKSHYYLAIGSVWLLSSGIAISFHLYICDILSLFICYVITFTILILSCSTILISYMSIWIKMKFFTKIHQSRTMQENKNLTKTLFIVTVVSLITWSPMNIVKVFDNSIVDKDYDLIFKLLILSNSLINVIVYSFRIPEFKRVLKDMFFIRFLTRSCRRIGLKNVHRNAEVIQLQSFQTNRT